MEFIEDLGFMMYAVETTVYYFFQVLQVVVAGLQCSLFLLLVIYMWEWLPWAIEISLNFSIFYIIMQE